MMKLVKSVDAGGTVDLILLDFSKAFDTVCHSILITKLHHLGISSNILSWIHNFLTGRKMSVVVDG